MISEIGNRYGRLVIKSQAPTVRKRARWVCLCDCGAETVVNGKELRQGKTRSCGCFKNDRIGSLNFSHGQARGRSQSPELRSYMGAKRRCTNPGTTHYDRWGGRGITMCDDWLNSFEAFFRDMGPMPSGARYTLDRIDNDGPYQPGNCRWATYKEQAANRREDPRTIIVAAFGETKSLAAFSAERGLDSAMVRQRVQRRGWDPERALTTPVNTKHRRKA